MTITSVGALPAVTFAADVVAEVAGDADLWAIAAALVEADVGALAVGDGDDISRVVWCDAASTVAEVDEEMMAHYVRHVLVEDDGRVVGIVSIRDLLGAYATVEAPDE